MKFNQKGKDISTIGVRNSLDFDLLRNLVDADRRSNHFIGELVEDIQKVFSDELQSFAYQTTKGTEIEIEIPKNFKIKEFYGYQPKYIS